MELLQDLLGQYFRYDDDPREYFGIVKAITPTR